jgi:hypothetical protein
MTSVSFPHPRPPSIFICAFALFDPCFYFSCFYSIFHSSLRLFPHPFLPPLGNRNWRLIVSRAGPFVLSHQSSSFLLDGLGPAQLPFPEVPGIAKYIVHYCMAWRYRGVWRFSPSDCFGARNPGAYQPRTREGSAHGRKDEVGNAGLNENGNNADGMRMSWKRAAAMVVLMLSSVILAFLLIAVLKMLDVAFKARNL